MARAQTVTQLSLDRFAEIIGFNPLHFNQVNFAGAQGPTCGQAILQYAWQYADRVSREDIALAIKAAEENIISWTGFDIVPTWNADERHLVRGQSQLLHTGKRKLLTGGQRAQTLVQAGVAVVYSDADGDGYKEKATISVATTVTDTNELQIYYPGNSGNSEWRVYTISVSIAAGTATIVTRRERLVKPELMERIDATGIDGSDDANFLTTVDVYRVYNDPSKQVDFLINSCCATGCTQCNYSLQSGCIAIMNDAFIKISPGDWDGTQFNAAPCMGYWDRIRLWYKAGFNSVQLEQAVAYLALTYLDRPLCSCSNIETATKFWAFDLASRTSVRGGAISYNLSRGLLDCPFGTTRGGLFAWRAIKDA